MNIVDLPIEIQNNIFYFYAEHPCAKMLKEAMNNYFIDYKKDGIIILTQIQGEKYCMKHLESFFQKLILTMYPIEEENQK